MVIGDFSKRLTSVARRGMRTCEKDSGRGEPVSGCPGDGQLRISGSDYLRVGWSYYFLDNFRFLPRLALLAGLGEVE